LRPASAHAIQPPGRVAQSRQGAGDDGAAQRHRAADPATTPARLAMPMVSRFNASLESFGIEDVAPRPTGEVTITSMQSAMPFFLPDILKDYHRRFPGILVRVIDQGVGDRLALCPLDEAPRGLWLDFDKVWLPSGRLRVSISPSNCRRWRRRQPRSSPAPSRRRPRSRRP
jgi:DNA-binding transcriptional LysR family regulator